MYNVTRSATVAKAFINLPEQWRVCIAHPILQQPGGKKQNVIETDSKVMQSKTVTGKFNAVSVFSYLIPQTSFFFCFVLEHRS